MPLALHHLALVVADLARAEQFYAGVLALPVIRRGDDDRGRPRSVWVDLGGGAFLALERAEEPEPKRADEAPGLHCLALAIEKDQRKRWQEKLAAAGHPTVRETAFTFYVRDPDDVLIGFSHYPEM